MNFTEDGEEITYSVIESNIFDKVMQLICEKQESIIFFIEKKEKAFK